MIPKTAIWRLRASTCTFYRLYHPSTISLSLRSAFSSLSASSLFLFSLSPLHPRYSSNPSTTAMPLANLHNLVYSPLPLSSSASCNRDTNGWSEPKVCSEMSTMGVALVALSGLLPARHSYQRRTSVLCNRMKSSWSLHDHICGVPPPSRTSSLGLNVENCTVGSFRCS
jgi:hypothetical protein